MEETSRNLCQWPNTGRIEEELRILSSLATGTGSTLQAPWMSLFGEEGGGGKELCVCFIQITGHQLIPGLINPGLCVYP